MGFLKATFAFLAAAWTVSATTKIYMRIEGPTHTIYEETLEAVNQAILSNDGHTATCDGTPEGAAGVTSLTALAQTGQYFYTNWNGSTYGFIKHINGTSNDPPGGRSWATVFNDFAENGELILQGGGFPAEFDSFCYQTLTNLQHMLYAFGNVDSLSYMFMSGPSTATIGVPVNYTVFSPASGTTTWVNDLSTDATFEGERVFANVTLTPDGNGVATITFKEAGSYNMKAHCGAGVDCVRSNHVVTTVSE